MIMTKTYYVTKYALTKGIIEVKGAQITESGSLTKGVWFYINKGDFFETAEAAQERAKEMANNKLNSLNKQIGKLNDLIFKGARVRPFKSE